MSNKMENPSFVLQSVKQVSIEDRPIPQLRDAHDVLVRVAQTGICGSDVHYWQRGQIGEFVLTSPMVLGHESSGTVVEVGDAVTSLKPGDRVAMEPGVPCRRCEFCRKGRYNVCEDTVFAATPPHDGTLARYYVNAEDFCYKIPDAMTMEEAAMVEPLSVACAIVKVAEIAVGMSVLVFGAGPIGVLSTAVARQAGAGRIVVVDVVDARLAVAKRYGADATYMPRRASEGVDPASHAETVANELRRDVDVPSGFDVVLECSGAEPCIQIGIFAAKRGGIFVQAGMGKEVINFPITAMVTKGLVVKGSIRYQPDSYPAAINLIASGKVDVKGLITSRFKFEQAEEAFELVKAAKPDVFKVMIEGPQ